MISKGTTLSTIATLILVSCALILTAMTVRREFFVTSPSGSSVATEQQLKPEQWTAISAVGHRMGSTDPWLDLVEFGDFECPACRRFATQVLPELRRQLPGAVRVTFRHWTLGYHRFAVPAARAAECAATQHRFAAMHDLLFTKQDSLGLKSFESFAAEAGVPDISRFKGCIVADSSLPVLARDTATANELGGIGTPLIIANGIQFRGLPTAARLLQIARNKSE